MAAVDIVRSSLKMDIGLAAALLPVLSGEGAETEGAETSIEAGVKTAGTVSAGTVPSGAIAASGAVASIPGLPVLDGFIGLLDFLESRPDGISGSVSGKPS